MEIETTITEEERRGKAKGGRSSLQLVPRAGTKTGEGVGKASSIKHQASSDHTRLLLAA